MIENPLEWFKQIMPYIVKPSTPSYGDLCIIDINAPTYVKEMYDKYLYLLHKCIQSWDCLIFEGLRITGIDEEKASKLSKEGKEQLDILFELIDRGIIDNDPFIKII